MTTNQQQSPSSVQEDAIENLTTVFLTTFNTPFEAVTHSLHELQQNQVNVLATFSSENDKLTNQFEIQNNDIFETFNQLQNYITKLQRMKKEMLALSTKVNKLKQRAEKLQMKKMERDKQLAEKQQKQREKDEKLMARPAPHLEASQHQVRHTKAHVKRDVPISENPTPTSQTNTNINPQQ